MVAGAIAVAHGQGPPFACSVNADASFAQCKLPKNLIRILVKDAPHITHMQISSCHRNANLLLSPICNSPHVTYMQISSCHLYLYLLMSPICTFPHVTYMYISSCHLYAILLMPPICHSSCCTLLGQAGSENQSPATQYFSASPPKVLYSIVVTYTVH